MTVLKHLKAPIRVLAVFILFLLLMYILITQTNLPEQLAGKVFHRMIGSQYDISLTVGDIGGSLTSGLRLKNVHLHHKLADTLYQIAYIEDLTLEYSLTDLWRQQWVLKRLAIDKFEVGLNKEILNRFSGTSEDTTKKKTLDFKINEFSINSASIKNTDLDQSLIVDKLNLSLAVSKKGDSISIGLDTAFFKFAVLDIDIENFSGNYNIVGSSLNADSVRLAALQSELLISCKIDDLSDIVYDINIYHSDLNLERIGSAFGTELIGNLHLRGNLNGDFKTVYGDVSVDGSIFEKSLNKISTKLEFADNQVSFYDLKGGAFSSVLRGDGLLDFKVTPNSYLFSGHMSNFNLNTLVENTFETSFSGEVIVEGQSFSEDEFLINIKADLDSGFFDLYEFDSVYGYADVYLDSILFREPLTVERMGAKLQATGKIDYIKDINIQGGGHLPDLTPLMQILELENIYGRGDVNFSFKGPVEDPGLTAEFFSDSIVAYDVLSDSLHVDIDLKHFALYQEGEMDVSGGLFHFSRYDGDSLFSEIIFDSNRILIDTFRMYSKRLSSDFSMSTEFTDSLVEIRVPEFAMVLDTFKIVQDDTLIFRARNSSFSIERLKLKSGSGLLNIKGSSGMDGSLSYNLFCNDLNLTPILGFYVPDQGLEGIFSFQAQLNGSVSDPEFTIIGKAESISMLGQKYGNLYCDIDYKDSTVTVDSFSLKGTENSSVISGTIPLNLAFEDVSERLIPDKRVDLEVGSRGMSFLILPVILKDIEWVEGTNALDLKVTGTPDNPLFEGNYYLRDGRVKVYYLENVLENIKADIVFDGREMKLDSVVSLVRNGTKVSTAILTGSISLDDLLKPSINLSVDAKNYPFKYDLGDIEGVIGEAHIEIAGQDTIEAYGNVEMASFKYSESFEPAIESGAMQAVTKDNKFNYIIDIFAPSNLKVVNQDFNVELSGELRIFNQGNIQYFFGELETLRGKYYFFDQTFTILPGGEIRFEDIEEFNPNLNIEVETGVTSQGERLKALLILTGTLLEPKIIAANDSEVGENQFYEYLSIRRFQTSSDEASGSAFDKRLTYGATEFAIGRFSQFLGQKIGLETFEITPFYDGDEMVLEEAELRLGLYTMPNLYIYGSTRLDFSRAREVGFEYRFSRRLFLGGQRDDHDLYHLNLNLNWDF
jgi:TamB, inner membrane protein subunit of TAM complex